MDNRDELIRKQMDEISKLINANLRSLAEELNPKIVEKRKTETEKESNIIPFPGKFNPQ